ncbi:MAG: hypothetical protein OXU20_18060 [Myxococcales bacterium]|nr:hypothetical protein [Myxococcales bacterium]
MGKLGRMWLGVLSYWLAAGCGPANQTGASSEDEGLRSAFWVEPALPRTQDGAIDSSGGPLRVVEVPSLSGKPSIVSTPNGYFALSRHTFSSGKATLGYTSALYHAVDGVHWRRVPLADSSDLELTDLAYGNGRWIMVGRHRGGDHVYRHSHNGLDWTERVQGLVPPFAYRRLAFVAGRFFGLGSGQLGVSENGERWAHVPIALVQPMAIAHGNGRYVLMGSGPVEVSEDGLAWSAHELPCDLPGACVSDPDGGIHQGHQSHLLFVEGRFFTDQLTSVDGLTWRPLPGRRPVTYADGFFFEPHGLALRTWTTEGDEQRMTAVRSSEMSITLAARDRVGFIDAKAPLPDEVDVSFADGLTCDVAACLIVDGRLFLFPPAGTPPLPDLQPRDANDRPLLTDMCPISRQIFCDDYASRTGCECHAFAPQGPEGCERVSHFTCQGHFTRRDDEWHVAEIAEAGCSCSAEDHNEPDSFGAKCDPARDADTCAAPLSCLGVDTPSPGPAPRRFMCTAACESDADCPTWNAAGFCGGPVQLRCSRGSCQPRTCRR